jgi:micrococcal nuclease
MTTEGRFCPTCGTKRTGFFRFCASCGFDFDELGPKAPAPMPIAPGQVALPQTPVWPKPVAWPPVTAETPATPETSAAPTPETQARPVPQTPPSAAPAPLPPTFPATLTPARPSILETVTTVRPEQVAVAPKSRERTLVRVAIIALAGLLVLSAISNAISSQRSSATAPPTVALGTPLVVESPGTGGTPPSPGATFGPTGQTQFAVVTSVTDGDTIRVDIDGTEYPLRYIGIDAPEPNAYDPTLKSLADAATDANRRLVEGQDVYLEREVSDTDQFARLLRNVWLIGSEGEYVLVNLEMVRGGLARVATFPPDDKYRDLLTVAQDSAKTAAVGLWSPASSDAPGSSPATVPASPITLVGGGGGGGSDCHPSYTPCLPIVDDLDCSEVVAMGAAPVAVKGPDDYELDAEDDGLGCE